MTARLNSVALIVCWSVVAGCSSAPATKAGPPVASAAVTATPPAAMVAAAPAAAPASASAPEVAPASMSAAAPAAAAAAASTPVSMTPDLAALTKQARAYGYTPRYRNGTLVFCKSDQQIGTRFQTLSCISQADVANVVSRAQSEKDDVDALQRKSKLQPMGN